MALEEGFAAVYAGDAAALEAWLSQGGDANARVPFDDNLEWAGGETLLRSALVSKKSTKHDVIRALLQRGADPNLNPYSCIQGQARRDGLLFIMLRFGTTRKRRRC